MAEEIDATAASLILVKIGLAEEDKRAPEVKARGISGTRARVDSDELQDGYGFGEPEDEEDSGADNSFEARAQSQRRASVVESITTSMVEPYFHLPLKDAAEELGISVNSLKRACRKLGILKWPYRQLKWLERHKRKMERAMIHGKKLFKPCNSSQLLSQSFPFSVDSGNDLTDDTSSYSDSVQNHASPDRGLGAQVSATNGRQLVKSKWREPSVDAQIGTYGLSAETASRRDSMELYPQVSLQNFSNTAPAHVSMAQPTLPVPQAVRASVGLPTPPAAFYPEMYKETVPMIPCFASQPLSDIREPVSHFFVGPSFPYAMSGPTVYSSVQGFWPTHTTRLMSGSVYQPLLSTVPPRSIPVPYLQPQMSLPVHQPQLSLVPPHVPLPLHPSQMQLQLHSSPLSIAPPSASLPSNTSLSASAIPGAIPFATSRAPMSLVTAQGPRIVLSANGLAASVSMH